MYNSLTHSKRKPNSLMPGVVSRRICSRHAMVMQPRSYLLLPK